jgi:predicted nucleic acid-binding protein
VTFVVVYDACVLYPNTLRDLLIRIGQAGLVQAKWTDRILDEVCRNLQTNLPDVPAEKLERLRRLMNSSIRDCLVRGFEPLIEAVKLPDPDDRHVLAAAIRAKAQMIVTSNLKDFPLDDIGGWDIEAKSPDDFVLAQIDLNQQAVYGAVQRIADSRRNPPDTIDDVLTQLERSGMVASVAALRTFH